MSKKHKHEDHVNHEAWAIPYGDLVTLLLALFVVMYAVSSVNEGKFKQAAASMKAAFNGTPTSMTPIQLGEQEVKGNAPVSADTGTPASPMQALNNMGLGTSDATGIPHDIEMMASAIKTAMGDLIKDGVVVVRSTRVGLEVEIQTDILFPSGAAKLSPKAVVILKRLADVLSHFKHVIQIEGHTDNMPIHTNMFPSNWELSAARAASVVHLFIEQSIAPERLSLSGQAQYHPEDSNDSEKGRNRNRRVVLVIPAKKDIIELLEKADLSAKDIQAQAPNTSAHNASPATVNSVPVSKLEKTSL